MLTLSLVVGIVKIFFSGGRRDMRGRGTMRRVAGRAVEKAACAKFFDKKAEVQIEKTPGFHKRGV